MVKGQRGVSVLETITQAIASLACPCNDRSLNYAVHASSRNRELPADRHIIVEIFRSKPFAVFSSNFAPFPLLIILLLMLI